MTQNTESGERSKSRHHAYAGPARLLRGRGLLLISHLAPRVTQLRVVPLRECGETRLVKSRSLGKALCGDRRGYR